MKRQVSIADTKFAYTFDPTNVPHGPFGTLLLSMSHDAAAATHRRCLSLMQPSVTLDSEGVVISMNDEQDADGATALNPATAIVEMHVSRLQK